jgi:hypothetical protein
MMHAEVTNHHRTGGGIGARLVCEKKINEYEAVVSSLSDSGREKHLSTYQIRWSNISKVITVSYQTNNCAAISMTVDVKFQPAGVTKKERRKRKKKDDEKKKKN